MTARVVDDKGRALKYDKKMGAWVLDESAEGSRFLAEEMSEAKALQKELLEAWQRLAKESAEAGYAFLIAVLRGEDGREDALNQGGDPKPEKAAFEMGLKCKPLLEKIFWAWVSGLIRGAGLAI